MPGDEPFQLALQSVRATDPADEPNTILGAKLRNDGCEEILEILKRVFAC